MAEMLLFWEMTVLNFFLPHHPTRQLEAEFEPKATFDRYTDIVFQGFFTRKLDIMDKQQIIESLKQANMNDGTSSDTDWMRGYEEFVKKEEDVNTTASGEGWKELERIRNQGIDLVCLGYPCMLSTIAIMFGNDRVLHIFVPRLANECVSIVKLNEWGSALYWSNHLLIRASMAILRRISYD